jgi:4-amino-4-deoxychorismate lyase
MADRVLMTLDGEVRDLDAPLVHADDIGVLRGDGVFETLLVRGGRACAVELHLARLASSAEALALPEPDRAEWRAAVDLAVEKWGGDREGVLRLVYTRGREDAGSPTAFLLLTPVPERVLRTRREGVSVVTLERGYSVDVARTAPWQLIGAKTLSYATNMAALRHAEALGVDDVIYTSSEGYVLEGPRSTVVIARGRTLLTPPTEMGVLPGTTQQALFDVAGDHDFAVRYEPLRPADLIVADGVWLVSSVSRAARVHMLDGHPLSVRSLAGTVEELVDKAVDAAS